jgi:hypothetical protein
MSHPLLEQLDRIIDLIDKVHNSSIEPAHRVEVEKYLRWAARKVTKAYWRQIDTEPVTVSVWDQVAHALNEDD